MSILFNTCVTFKTRVSPPAFSHLETVSSPRFSKGMEEGREKFPLGNFFSAAACSDGAEGTPGVCRELVVPGFSYFLLMVFYFRLG